MTVLRHSSRRAKLDSSLLQARLSGAASYDRIAGYFRLSLLEVAGEAIENVSGKVRVVCNSDLEHADVETAKAAQQAMRQSWCASCPEKLAVTTDAGRGRFARLFDLRAAMCRLLTVTCIWYRAATLSYPQGIKTFARRIRTCPFHWAHLQSHFHRQQDHLDVAGIADNTAACNFSGAAGLAVGLALLFGALFLGASSFLGTTTSPCVESLSSERQTARILSQTNLDLKNLFLRELLASIRALSRTGRNHPGRMARIQVTAIVAIAGGRQ